VTVSFSLTSVCVKSVLTGGSGRTTISSDNFFGVDDEGGNRLEVISAVVGISIEILVIFSIFSTVSVVFSTSFNSIVFSGSGSVPKGFGDGIKATIGSKSPAKNQQAENPVPGTYIIIKMSFRKGFGPKLSRTVTVPKI
jgi:hypothetical protein